MSIALILTLVWFFIMMFSLGLTRYLKIALPKVNQWHNILILILEVLAIAFAIYFNKGINPSLYILFAAIFLLLVGWIKSHQSLLLRFFKGTKKRPWLWRINLLIEGSEHSQNIYFLGDWFQVLAIALVWNSILSLIISCVMYPILVYIFSSVNTRNFNRKVTNKSELIKNEAWANFIKTALGNIIRSIFIILFLITPIAVMKREWIIFFGTPGDAINLITTLAQVEATVFALVITFLFVLVEFTNSAYSPRLVRSFTNQWPFKLMVLFAFTSITTKFWLMANVPRYINLQTVSENNILIDWTLILTALSVLFYFVFIRDTINLMQPEAIARQILVNFDEEWIGIVRKNWKNRHRIERVTLYDNDPMILFERYLATTVERGDIYSTKTSLALMGDRISHIMDKDDGPIIDNYLYSRLGHIVNNLAASHSDLGLEIFCGVISVITSPSSIVLKSSDVGTFDAPPGMQLLGHVAEKAVDFQLLNSGRQAIWRIGDRCESAIKALPSYSELWLINPDNLNKTQIEKEKYWKNDRQLGSVVDGHFSFLRKLGQKAIKAKSQELAWATTNMLSHQILHIIDEISEEPYQRHLIVYCLWNLEEVVRSACEEKMRDAITFGILSFGVEKIESANNAMIVSNTFSNIIELMAKAGILDTSHVRDIAIMAVYLSHKHPLTTIPILNGLGLAGDLIGKNGGELRQDYLSYLYDEILGRIDQVEKAGLAGTQRGIKTKVSLAAKNARKKTQKKIISKSKK